MTAETVQKSCRHLESDTERAQIYLYRYGQAIPWKHIKSKIQKPPAKFWKIYTEVSSQTLYRHCPLRPWNSRNIKQKSPDQTLKQYREHYTKASSQTLKRYRDHSQALIQTLKLYRTSYRRLQPEPETVQKSNRRLKSDPETVETASIRTRYLPGRIWPGWSLEPCSSAGGGGSTVPGSPPLCL